MGNRFTAQELCSILESCGKAGVSSIKFGDLDATFHGGKREGLADQPIIAEDGGTMPETFDRAQARAEDLEDLMLRDPEAYEKRLMSEA